MVVFGIQFAFVLAVAVFQMSFLNVAFSDISVNALLAVSIVWTMTRGFLDAWPWVVCLGCTADALSMDVVGVTACILLLFSYGSSFVSRRLLVEHRESGMVLATVCMSAFSFLFLPALFALRHFVFGSPMPPDVFAVSFGRTLSVSAVLSNIVILTVMYGVVSRMNRAFDFYGDRVVVKR